MIKVCKIEEVSQLELNELSIFEEYWRHVGEWHSIDIDEKDVRYDEYFFDEIPLKGIVEIRYEFNSVYVDTESGEFLYQPPKFLPKTCIFDDGKNKLYSSNLLACIEEGNRLHRNERSLSKCEIKPVDVDDVVLEIEAPKGAKTAVILAEEERILERFIEFAEEKEIRGLVVSKILSPEEKIYVLQELQQEADLYLLGCDPLVAAAGTHKIHQRSIPVGVLSKDEVVFKADI